MPKDPIVQTGAPVLREAAKPLAKKDITSRTVHALIARMKKALTAEPHGVGLAACQVGEPLQLFIIAGRAFTNESEEDKPQEDMVIINPRLLRTSKKKEEMSEGCLSVRGKYGSVKRFKQVTIRALDERGKPFTYNASGLIAHVIQHELDHLKGVLFTERATSLEDWDDHA